MSDQRKKITLADQTETEARAREIQLLINIAEPDPEYQPFITTDDASLLDSVGTAPADIQRRLEAYFGEPVTIPLTTPLWRFVDMIRERRPEWPEDM
jgi:hypothetical protein